MCPAAGIEPLRVGPEDPTASEAGELVKKVGVGRHAKELIRAVHKQMPKALRSALARYEHVQRSKYLRSDEVERALNDYLEQAPEAEKVEIVEVLGARVRANKTDPMRNSYVLVLFETGGADALAGRTARVALSYPDYFRGSIADFDNALSNGEVDLADEGKLDVATLRRQNEQLQAEVKRLAKEGGGQAAADAITSEDVKDIVAAAVQQALDEERAEREAEDADAPAADEAPAAADPSADGDEAPADPPAPELLTEVPEAYDFRQIIAEIGTFSDDVLAELAKDSRSSVAAAASSEQTTRKG